MSFIPTIVSAVVTAFKADPKRIAHIVVTAIGHLTVASLVIDQAIVILRSALTGLGG